MDLETIKIIADTATQLTGEAKQVFVWWLLGKEVLSMLLHAAVITTIVVLGYKLIRDNIGSKGSDGYLRLKRDEFQIGSPGFLSEGERRATISEIERRLKEANK